jgi:glycosyltransferase involved in cell wall biosynthesis
LLIVKNSKESSWGSCKVISPNLHSLYSGLGSSFEIDWFELSENLLRDEINNTDSKILNLVNKIKNFNPDRLIFIDHLPPHGNIIAFISMLISTQSLPPIIFHIYGDFTYFSKEWGLLNELLPSHLIKFVVASEAQKRLLQNFFKVKNNDLTDVLCFPYNPNEYFFSSEHRDQLRLEMGLSNDDFIILYTGRVSLQKNVDILIESFSRLENHNKNLYLWIAGGFDDIGANFMGIESYHGYMYAKIHKIMDALPENIKGKIKIYGHVNKDMLLKIKCASDMYVSLSTYHDEDFGMSPAEALATGLPAALTDWGGYSSFKIDGVFLKLIGVKISEYGLVLNIGDFEKYVNEIIALNLNSKEREAYANTFKEKFSVEANIKRLEFILKNEFVKFEGFNWELDQYAESLGLNWSQSKLNKFLNPVSNSFYSDIYNNYISIRERS